MTRLSDRHYSFMTNACMVIAIGSAVWFDRGSNQAVAAALGVISAVVAACAYFCSDAPEVASAEVAANEQQSAESAAASQPTHTTVGLSFAPVPPHDDFLPTIQFTPTIVFGGRYLKSGWEFEAICQPDQPSTQFARDVLDVVEWFGRGDVQLVLTHHGTVASVRSVKPPAAARSGRRVAEWEFVESGARY